MLLLATILLSCETATLTDLKNIELVEFSNGHNIENPLVDKFIYADILFLPYFTHTPDNYHNYSLRIGAYTKTPREQIYIKNVYLKSRNPDLEIMVNDIDRELSFYKKDTYNKKLESNKYRDELYWASSLAVDRISEESIHFTSESEIFLKISILDNYRSGKIIDIEYVFYADLSTYVVFLSQ